MQMIIPLLSPSLTKKIVLLPHAAHLNADLAALCEYGTYWNIEFAPLKTFSLVASLKSDTSNHPSLYLNAVRIPEWSSVRVLGFIFDSSLTWQKHIDSVLSCKKQCLGQLYRCRSLFGNQGIATLYNSWIHPVLEHAYGCIVQYRLIWIIWIGSKLVLRKCVVLHFNL